MWGRVCLLLAAVSFASAPPPPHTSHPPPPALDVHRICTAAHRWLLHAGPDELDYAVASVSTAQLAVADPPRTARLRRSVGAVMARLWLELDAGGCRTMHLAQPTGETKRAMQHVCEVYSRELASGASDG